MEWYFLGYSEKHHIQIKYFISDNFWQKLGYFGGNFGKMGYFYSNI